MYHGEVNIAQEELNSFLSVAEELQVKGLTQNTQPELPPAPVKRPLPTQRQPEAAPIPKHVRPRPQLAVPPPSQPPQQDEILEMPAPIKIEPQPVSYPSSSVAITSDGYVEEVNTMDTISREVASMEESYREEGYEDYGGYDGQEYEGQGYGGDGAEGQKGNSFFLLSVSYQKWGFCTSKVCMLSLMHCRWTVRQAKWPILSALFLYISIYIPCYVSPLKIPSHRFEQLCSENWKWFYMR